MCANAVTLVNVPGEVAENVCRTGTNKPENISTGCRLGLVWCYKRYQGLEPQGTPGGKESRSEQRDIGKRRLDSLPIVVGLVLQAVSGPGASRYFWRCKYKSIEEKENISTIVAVWGYSTRSDRAWSLIGLVWSYSGDRAWSLKALLEMQNKKEK